VADLRGIEVQLDDGMSAAMDHMSLRLSESQLVMDPGEGRRATVDLSPLLDHWQETGEVGTVPPLTDEVGCTRGHFLPRWARIERIGDRHRVAALEGQWLVPITPACP
jgi:hypothetical protein